MRRQILHRLKHGHPQAPMRPVIWADSTDDQRSGLRAIEAHWASTAAGAGSSQHSLGKRRRGEPDPSSHAAWMRPPPKRPPPWRDRPRSQASAPAPHTPPQPWGCTTCCSGAHPPRLQPLPARNRAPVTRYHRSGVPESTAEHGPWGPPSLWGTGLATQFLWPRPPQTCSAGSHLLGTPGRAAQSCAPQPWRSTPERWRVVPQPPYQEAHSPRVLVGSAWALMSPAPPLSVPDPPVVAFGPPLISPGRFSTMPLSYASFVSSGAIALVVRPFPCDPIERVSRT